MTRSLRLLIGFIALFMMASNAQAQRATMDSLRVGDVLKLRIWREEDLSGEFQVPEDGMVVLPKIGPWKVTNRPTVALRQEIVAAYQKYLRNTSIEITFLRRVNVLGAVNEPGVYPLDETMTIANALALAGGARQDGKADEVQLFRDGQRLKAKISQRTPIAELPIRSGDQLYVPERSWLSRAGVIPAVVSGLVTLTIAWILQK
jgi:protein involved in polysaccharide export with SLBB domain